MQFLSFTSMTYIRIVFLVTIAYFLVKDPSYITHSNFAILLGLAMQVNFASIDPKNPLLSLLAVVFASLALGDLIPLLAENLNFFETMVPTRLILYFFLAAYSYFAKTSVFSNNLIFTYAFFEIWFNFLIYNNLRDEKYYRVKKFVEENGDKIRDIQNEQVRIVELDE